MVTLFRVTGEMGELFTAGVGTCAYGPWPQLNLTAEKVLSLISTPSMRMCPEISLFDAWIHTAPAFMGQFVCCSPPVRFRVTRLTSVVPRKGRSANQSVMRTPEEA